MCNHQRAVKPLARLMNFIDILLGRGRFAVSAANDDRTYLIEHEEPEGL